MLVIATESEEKNERIFQSLKNYTNEIQKEIPEASWEDPTGKRRVISITKDIPSDINSISETEKSEIIDWSAKTMKKFSDVFSEYFQKI